MPNNIPTVGRIIHVYYTAYGSVHGPFAGLVIERTGSKRYINVRIFEPDNRDSEVWFWASSSCTNSDYKGSHEYRWEWPPKEEN
jgi:hypothetical protein